MRDNFLIILGNLIREKRSSLGFSQEGFAAHIGLHRTYVGSVERGERNISIRNFLLIAEALSVTPSDLLKEAERRAASGK
jgi:transcriptional regulator with XRE-family HTH domain